MQDKKEPKTPHETIDKDVLTLTEEVIRRNKKNAKNRKM